MSARRLLTVIIPVYNGADTIGRCLDSLVAIREAERRLEVIVVNDGSTDDTLRVLEEYHSGHPTLSLQILSQRNQGQSAARNSGLEVARGEYIWFVDADDWVDSETADYLLSLIAGKETYDMLCFGVRNRAEANLDKDVASEWLEASIHNFTELACVDGETLLRDYHLLGSSCLFLWRRKMLEQHEARFIEGIVFEDALFYWRYTGHAQRALLVPRVGYYYYQRADSSIHSPKTLWLRIRSRLEGALALLKYAEEVSALRDFYLERASTYYRISLRMVGRLGKLSDLKLYVKRMEQEGDYRLLMRHANRRGAPLIYLAHKAPRLFQLVTQLLPPVS